MHGQNALEIILLGKAVARKSAIQRAFDTEDLGNKIKTEPFVLVSVAIFKAFITLRSISLIVITTLGLCILINPFMLAYTACTTGTSEFDIPESAPTSKSKILNLLSLHTTCGQPKAEAASAQGQKFPPKIAI